MSQWKYVQLVFLLSSPLLSLSAFLFQFCKKELEIHLHGMTGRLHISLRHHFLLPFHETMHELLGGKRIIAGKVLRIPFTLGLRKRHYGPQRLKKAHKANSGSLGLNRPMKERQIVVRSRNEILVEKGNLTSYPVHQMITSICSEPPLTK